VIIGFTGTQRGVTDAQFDWLRAQLASRQGWPFTADENEPAVLHHGDCIGADYIAHHLAIELGYRVVIHPPNIITKRACCGTSREINDGLVTILPLKPYLERNRDIVEACDVLLALPDGPERQRSGTWSTVRLARRLGKEVSLREP
jgi:hypothetical protein